MKEERQPVSTAALEREREETTRDPISGKPGYPVGNGVRAAVGVVGGAVIGGTVGGPVGTLVGAAIGGIAGGLVGHGIAEGVNPTEEDAYWRESYLDRPYAQNRSYEDLGPAYRYGWEARARYTGRGWHEVEPELKHKWETSRGSSKLSWEEARAATIDAWLRVQNLPRSSESSNWDQIYPSHSRLGTLWVPLQELHDGKSGRLDATRFAEYLDLPLKRLAEAMGKNYSAIHKTPASPDVQPFLQSVKTSLVVLEDVLGNRSAVLVWLNHPHPDLGQRTPLDVILQGHPNAVKNMLQAAVMGIPS